MAKTTAQINTELTFYQCCLADLAYYYIKKEENGQQHIECLLNTLVYGTQLLEALKCPQRSLIRNYLTQDQLEAQLELLGDLCGCVHCEDASNLINDTL